MRAAELDYQLPAELIAQTPATPRDASRLMVVERSTGAIHHRVFRDLGEFLRSGDTLVVNDTRVIPARFECRRASGGRIEGLYLGVEGDAWRALLKPSSRLRVSERLISDSGQEFELLVRHERGEWSLAPTPPVAPIEFLRRFGHVPLPPYINRGAERDEDIERYQTVYANRDGAIAAPTAGLHFTPALLERLREIGVRRATVTLHVGVGTFAPLEVDDLRNHRMHSEWRSFTTGTAELLSATRREGGRIVAVGTTSARVLESLPEVIGSADVTASEGLTDIFIYPPYCFRNVDALITNFHLPRSTLLALVMAFAGADLTRRAYELAITERYRFFSYGDAVVIV